MKKDERSFIKRICMDVKKINKERSVQKTRTLLYPKIKKRGRLLEENEQFLSGKITIL